MMALYQINSDTSNNCLSILKDSRGKVRQKGVENNLHFMDFSFSLPRQEERSIVSAELGTS